MVVVVVVGGRWWWLGGGRFELSEEAERGAEGRREGGSQRYSYCIIV